MNEFGTHDTIVARGTPPGRGGIAVVRVSGSRVADIAKALLGRLPPARSATLSPISGPGEEPIDTGIALYFPAPNSFTGEDVLELQTHGSPVIVEMLIERICGLGARLAEPGEFSRRAFLNDKIDLSQAEAIADLIDSSSRTAARAAQRSLQGRFSAIIDDLNNQVTDLRVYVEAALDFPEEEVDFLSDRALKARIDELGAAFAQVEAVVRQGCLLRDGVTVVLAGRPNAGKSSLLNALAGYDAAIVTQIPGTTRDLVKAEIELHGLPVHITDTAGLRAAADAVELEGIRRTRRELGTADHALVVTDVVANDDLDELLTELPSGLPCTIVRNKVDLTGEPAGRVLVHPGAGDPALARVPVVAVSALTGAGIDDLRARLQDALGYQPAAEGSVIARQRHLQSLRKAHEHFRRACAALSDGGAGELMADDLREVQNALAEITGQFSSDDLLGKIFESFCIGK